MSKSFHNYPDPKYVIEQYGGDAFRYYIASSVLPLGEDLNVSEEAIAQPIKDILLPLMNTYKYFALYANQHGFDPTLCEVCPKKATCDTNAHILDRWAITRLKQAAISMDKNMAAYQIPKAVAEMKPLIDDISTWYIRRSRERFVAGDKYALNTLFTILVAMTKIFAPIIPFTSEYLYQELKKGTNNHIELESVHLELLPDFGELTSEEEYILLTMGFTREVASIGQSIRVETGIPVKQPLEKVMYQAERVLEAVYVDLIAEELNVQSVDMVKEMPTSKTVITKTTEKVVIGLETHITPELAEQGLLREVLRGVQSARKNSSLAIGQMAKLEIYTENNGIKELVTKYSEKLTATTFISEVSFLVEKPAGEDFNDVLVGPEKIALTLRVIG